MMYIVKLIGVPGQRYQRWRAAVLESIRQSNLRIRFEEINDLDEIMENRIESIPAILLNNQIVYQQNSHDSSVGELVSEIQNRLELLIGLETRNMLYNTKLSEIMTKNIITVKPLDTMDKVKDIFEENNIHHVPVVDKAGKLHGMIGKENLAMLSHHMTVFNREREVEFNKHLVKAVYVKEAMTKQVASLRPTDTVGVAVGIFRENLFHALPIVDEEGKMVGIVTTYDLLNFAFQEPKVY